MRGVHTHLPPPLPLRSLSMSRFENELRSHQEAISRRLTINKIFGLPEILEEEVEYLIFLEELEDEMAEALRAWCRPSAQLQPPRPPPPSPAPLPHPPLFDPPEMADTKDWRTELKDEAVPETIVELQALIDELEAKSRENPEDDFKLEERIVKLEALLLVMMKDERDEAWAQVVGSMSRGQPHHRQMAAYVDARIWEGAWMKVDEAMESGLRGAWMRRLIEKHEKAHGIKDPYWRHVTRVRILKEIWSKVEEYELPRRRRPKTMVEANMHLFPTQEPSWFEKEGIWKAVPETGAMITTRWRDASTRGSLAWKRGSQRLFHLDTARCVRPEVYCLALDREVAFKTNPFKLESEVRRV